MLYIWRYNLYPHIIHVPHYPERFVLHMIDHQPDCIAQRLDPIFTDFKNYFCVDIKIVMAYDIAHCFCTFPIDLRILSQKQMVGYLVEIFQGLPSGNQLHA